VKKSRQDNIAFLCLALMSKSVMASGFAGYSPLPKKEAVKITVGDVTKLGGFTSKTPVRPFNVDQVLGNGRLNPKLPGTFASPGTELAKGNVGQAKVSCIQQAMGDGLRIPNADASSAWEFAAKTTPASIIPLVKVANPNLLSNIGGTPVSPAAFRNKEICGAEAVNRAACGKLLVKSLNEIPQAYYKSEVSANPEFWGELGEFLGLRMTDDRLGTDLDFTSALAQSEKDLSGEPTIAPANGFSSNRTSDQLLVATQLLISRLDEALARGDRDQVEKVKGMLKRLNPSADYAVNCVLGSLANGGLNDNLEPSGLPQSDSMVGPLTGIDYGAQDELITKGSYGALIVSSIAAATAIVALITTWVNKSSDSDNWKKEQEAREKVIAADQLKEYLKCDLGAVCGKLYPEAAAAVEQAKSEAARDEAVKTGVSVPSRPVEDDMWAPSVKEENKPKPGSGGNGGELLPPDFDLMKPKPAKPVSSGDMINSRVDPEAGDRFCAKVVDDYRSFALDKLIAEGRHVETTPQMVAVGAQFDKSGYSVVPFDQWDLDFWREQLDIYRQDPSNRAKENNCHAKDPVRPL
jgi:hypothetical protein